MQKLKLTANILIIIFLTLILATGLWDLSIFYIPMFLIVGITIFAIINNYRRSIPCSVITIYLSLLLIYEIINYFISDYQPNSILFLRDFSLIICCIFFIEKNLRKERFQIYFIVYISLLMGVLSLFSISLFFFRYYEAAFYGFDDFSQFRFLYKPLGFLSNEWVTILLCVLPFPLIGSFLFWKKPLIRYGFLLITSLLIFNIIISFSRAGILSFFLFLILLNLFLYISCRFSIKRLLLPNIVLVILLILFTLSFSDSIRSSIRQTQSHQRSIEGRLRQWGEIKEIINNTPYFGIGSKNYALLGRSSQRVNFENMFTGRVNNTYIQLALEKGWVGFSLWLCIIGILVFYSFQRIIKGENRLDKAINSIIFSAICAVLFREFFFSSLFYNSGLLLFFFILLSFNRKETNKIVVVRKQILIGWGMVFASSSIYFYFKKPDDALFYAKKGLEYERTFNMQGHYNSFNKYFDFPINIKQDTIWRAIKSYKEACRLSPSDAMFQHNLGWLYWMNQQSDSAVIYLSKAVKLGSNIALYHVSKGLIEESLKMEQAFESYKYAILLSPDIIDSPFFKDLKEREGKKTKELLKDTSSELLQMLSIQYSSIIEAKSGKILQALGKTECAYSAFKNVTQIHPNLNRPWYNMGFIEQERGNFNKMKEFYTKSLFISPSDHLPLSALAYYYNGIGDKTRAKLYQKAMKKAWSNKRSAHSSQCKRMYYLDTERDDVIPKGFLDYITPFIKNKKHDNN